MRRILITGSRDWRDYKVIEAALILEYFKAPGPMRIVHGDAAGADRLADKAARHLTDHDHYLISIEKHPADWDTPCTPDCYHRPRHKNGRPYCPLAGHRRNQKMVDLGADVCLAFPLPNSRGTIDCMRRARDAGIEVINHMPKGYDLVIP